MRRESDFLGEVELPDCAYYGVQTARAVKNFPVSGIRESEELIRGYVILKRAAAIVNRDVGALDSERADAIVKACDALLRGEHLDQFPVDVFQAGAGTSVNMNVNEVLANLALEYLGHEKGEYRFLHPNDHVNLGQSTNDTFTSACHIAVILALPRLLGALDNLAATFEAKSQEFGNVIKSGRTHLVDALPIMLGHEMGAYASAVRRAMRRIDERGKDLYELEVGGTAVGTGANAHPLFRQKFFETIVRETKMPFHASPNSFESLETRAQLGAFMSSLKELSVELIRICNDLRLLASGPTTALGEIALPAVQPGSSIMPGKVNPSMPECLTMIAYQVIGYDTSVTLASQGGQLELNIWTPLMIHDVMFSMKLYSNFVPIFTERCVRGIVANEERCSYHLTNNPILATFLAPRIGYARSAELAEESEATGIPVPELAVKKGVITDEESKEIFDPKEMARVHFS
ncbi:MAG: aspartate ammonia-lyase [Methanomassiliicoccales archaeon]|jgi:aspartate ammonia-lyase